MNSRSTIPQRRHSTWQHLLQIAGALAIIGFHVGLPFCQAGWAAVEVFFVMAGMHMAPAMMSESGFIEYAASRYRRLLPEVALVWTVVLSLVLLGFGSPGMHWFLVSSPLGLQNLSPIFFQYQLPRDAVFGPLWFVGALLQLQLGCYALRKHLGNMAAARILWVALVLGATLRCLFSLPDFHHGGISPHMANLLYAMPFCHLEALVLGILIGRGDLKRLGNWLPAIAVIVALAGLGMLRFEGAHRDWHHFGYGFPLMGAFSQIWGYPLLALLAGALCVDGNPIRRFFAQLRLQGTTRTWLAKLAGLTFGAYCFHGMIIATKANGSELLGTSATSRITLFLITVAESFLLAGLFKAFRATLGRCITNPIAATSLRQP